MDNKSAQKKTLKSSTEALLRQVAELHHSGLTVDEIVDRMISMEKETATFRMRAFVEIVIEYSRICRSDQTHE